MDNRISQPKELSEEEVAAQLDGISRILEQQVRFGWRTIPKHLIKAYRFIKRGRLVLGITGLLVVLLGAILIGYNLTQKWLEPISKPVSSAVEILRGTNGFAPSPPVIEVLPDPEVPRELSAERRQELGQMMTELQYEPEPIITGFTFPPPKGTPFMTEAQATSGRALAFGPMPPIEVNSVLTDEFRVAGFVTEPNPSWWASIGNVVEDLDSKLQRRPIGEGSHVEGHATVQFEVTVLALRRAGHNKFKVELASPRAINARSMFLDDQLVGTAETADEFRALACSGGTELLALMQRVETSLNQIAAGVTLDFVWLPYGTADAAKLAGGAFDHCLS